VPGAAGNARAACGPIGSSTTDPREQTAQRPFDSKSPRATHAWLAGLREAQARRAKRLIEASRARRAISPRQRNHVRSRSFTGVQAGLTAQATLSRQTKDTGKGPARGRAAMDATTGCMSTSRNLSKTQPCTFKATRRGTPPDQVGIWPRGRCGSTLGFRLPQISGCLTLQLSRCSLDAVEFPKARATATSGPFPW